MDPRWQLSGSTKSGLGWICYFLRARKCGTDAAYLLRFEILRLFSERRHQLYQDICINNSQMKTLIQIHKEGKYFVAIDLITNVADQGLTEEEAVANLKRGLEEHYQVLLELAPKGRKLSFLDIEVERFAQASNSLG